MQAVVVRQFGPPSVLVAEEVPDPIPAADEVLIDVEIANVTFVDTQVRAGQPPHPAMLPALPAVLGNGVGGVVRSAGPGGDPELIGRRVITSLRGTGGYATRAVANLAGLIDVPNAFRMEEAVALLADGRTAMLLMQAAAIRPGETVLVEAAAGGVGSLLVQLAHQAGARVIGAAGSLQKLMRARELGAVDVVDYTSSAWSAQLASKWVSVDVVFDGVGGAIGRSAFELLSPGGRFCPFGMASGAFAPVSDAEAAARGVTVVRGGPLTVEESRGLAHMALAEAAAGRLRPLIGQTFALDRAAEAHEAIERRATIGKTLLVARRT